MSGLILIAFALHFSRCYTYHSGGIYSKINIGCLNPGMAISLELF